MADDDRDPSDGLRRLDQRLREAKARQAKEKTPSVANRGMGAGLRIAVELAAAVVVGAVIGILLDRWLGTSPWLLIVFFVLGCAAGFRNVIATANELDRLSREERAARTPPGVGVDRSSSDDGGRDQG